MAPNPDPLIVFETHVRINRPTKSGFDDLVREDVIWRLRLVVSWLPLEPFVEL
jgi:hypothetical protein